VQKNYGSATKNINYQLAPVTAPGGKRSIRGNLMMPASQ